MLAIFERADYFDFLIEKFYNIYYYGTFIFGEIKKIEKRAALVKVLVLANGPAGPLRLKLNSETKLNKFSDLSRQTMESSKDFQGKGQNPSVLDQKANIFF